MTLTQIVLSYDAKIGQNKKGAVSDNTPLLVPILQ